MNENERHLEYFYNKRINISISERRRLSSCLQSRKIFKISQQYLNPLEESLLELKSLTKPEKCSIMTQIAQGLNELHEASIINRDINPANILIVNDEGVKFLSSQLIQGQQQISKKKPLKNTQVKLKKKLLSTLEKHQFNQKLPFNKIPKNGKPANFFFHFWHQFAILQIKS